MVIIGQLLATIVALKVIEQIPRAARLKPFPRRGRDPMLFDSPFGKRRLR